MSPNFVVIAREHVIKVETMHECGLFAVVTYRAHESVLDWLAERFESANYEVYQNGSRVIVYLRDPKAAFECRLRWG